MPKFAVVILADTDSAENIARVHNALLAAKEFKEAGDEFKIIFDGAGTKWIKELSNPEHIFHELFESLKDKSTGVCSYCAGAFGVKDSISGSDIYLMEDYEGHPSFRQLIIQGYHIVTF